MKRVGLIIFPGFQMLAHVLATETLRIANKCAEAPVFAWDTRCVGDGGVTASNGALVQADVAGWQGAEGYDLVLLCAGYDPPAVFPAGLRSFLASVQRSGAMLGGLDTGTLVLARLGLLSGYEAVLHHEAEAGFREEWPEIAVSDRIYAIDRQRLTAAGGMATGDAMLAWIAQVHSPELADATSENMAHGVIRSTQERQRIERSDDPVLNEMKELMLTHLAKPLPIGGLARRLGVSQKQLRLRCVKGLGLTPVQLYLRLRLERALDFLRNTQMPMIDVALATGFGSAAGFSRAFRARYQSPPSAYRRAARGVHM